MNMSFGLTISNGDGEHGALIPIGDFAEWLRPWRDPGEFNSLHWPTGASRHATCSIILDSKAAASIRRNPRNPVTLSFKTPAKSIDFTMYQAGQYQLHYRTTDALYEVKLVDQRYFWQGNTSASANITTPDDRSEYYDSTEIDPDTPQTWEGLISNLANDLSISIVVDDISGRSGQFNPVDWLLYSEPAALTLDRVLASLGMFLVANSDGTFAAKTLESVAGNGMDPNIASPDLIAGGLLYQLDENGKAWLDAVMPSSVTVLFPRAIANSDPGAASTDPPVLMQFRTLTSTSGLPTGTTGRPGITMRLYDTTWALGADGTDNATALQARADFLSARFYARYKLPKGEMLFRGIQTAPVFPGVTSWCWNSRGPITRMCYMPDWGLYGGDRNVGGGFLDKRVIGLGGVQAWKSFDGSLCLKGSAGEGSRMRVKSIANDYLTCRMWDGTTEGTTDILVAKHYLLRHVYSNYSGLTSLTTVNTQQVTVTDGVTTETLRVMPLYTVDGEISATAVSSTGVTVDGTELTWVDDSNARAWGQV